MKTCSECKRSKDFSKFSLNKTRKDGYESICKSCKSTYQKERFKQNSEYRRKQKEHRYANVNRNREYVYSILQQSKCIDCAEARWQVLEFDHVKGQKIASICDMIRKGRSISSIDDEIAKCEIRCANCHRLKTATQFGWAKGI